MAYSGPRPPRPPATTNRKPKTINPVSGLTLLELVVVLSIVGIVLGLGVGMFLASRKDAGLRTAHAAALSMLRYARAQAVVRRAPASVRFDLPNLKVSALADRDFGVWHFEDLTTTGALGLHGAVRGGELEHGKVGYALRLKGSGNVTVDRVTIPPEVDALWVEAWVYPEDLGGRPAIFEKAKELALRAEADGKLNAELGTARIRVTAPRLAAQQWSHVRLVAEGGRAVLFLNGLEVGDAPLPRLPPSGATPFVIGERFRGLIDEVAIRGRAEEESVGVEATVAWKLANAVAGPKASGLSTIYFTDQGRLDPVAHRAPVTITLTAGDASRAIRIGWMGTAEP